MRRTPHPLKVLKWDCSNSVTSADSTSDSRSLAISTTSAITSFIENLNFSKSWIRVGVIFSKTPVNVAILTSSHKPWVFLMVSRMANPFYKVFSLFCPGPPEELLSLAAIALWNLFLIRLESENYSLSVDFRLEVALAGMKTTLISWYISIGALSDQVHCQWALIFWKIFLSSRSQQWA